MILISHRGNTNGKNPNLENNPDYILDAIKKGYECEVDVFDYDDGSFYLGHDGPTYKVDPEFMLNGKVWFHAKTIKVLHYLLRINAHCFFHENDKCTLTSRGYVWTFVGESLGPYKNSNNSICVLPEVHNTPKDAINSAGICSDFIEMYK